MCDHSRCPRRPAALPTPPSSALSWKEISVNCSNWLDLKVQMSVSSLFLERIKMKQYCLGETSGTGHHPF
jgi:hypothetical protein